MNKVLLSVCFFFLVIASTAQRVDTRMPSVNGHVNAIQRSGDTIYIGGSFTVVGGLPRKNLAAINAFTGQLFNWAPNPDSTVTDISVGYGKVAVTGYFDTIAGQAINYIAQFNASTGNIVAWNPFTPFHNTEYMLYSVYIHNNTIFAGGGASLYSIDATTGSFLWGLNEFRNVNSIVASGDTLFFGAFSNYSIAAVDLATGTTVYWSASANSAVTSIALANGKVFAAGLFYTVNGLPREAVVQLDMSGNVTSWIAPTNGQGFSVAVQGNYVYVAGLFSYIGNDVIEDNYRLGKLDINTADAVPYWDVDDVDSYVNGNGGINDVCVYDTVVYVAGDFYSIKQVDKMYFAALNPDCSNLNLTVAGGTVCSGNDGSITIYDSDSGVSYQAYQNGQAVGAPVTGTGNNIMLTIPAANLDSSYNTFSIHVSTTQCKGFLNSTATITTSPGSLPSTSGIYIGYPKITCPSQYIVPEGSALQPGAANTSQVFVYFSNPQEGVTYSPSLNNTVIYGAVYDSIPNATPPYLPSITFQSTELSPGNNFIKILATNTCGSVYLDTILTITYLTPTYVNTYIPPVTVCEDAGFELTIPNTIKNSALSYYNESSPDEFMLPRNATGSAINIPVYSSLSLGTNYLTIAVSTLVVGSGIAGCNVPIPNHAVVTLLPSPSVSVTLEGKDTLCYMSSTILQAVSSSNYTYQWYDEFDTIKGATAASYKVINNVNNNNGGSFTSFYSVTVTDSNGCSSNPYSNSSGTEIYFDTEFDSTILYKTTSFCYGDSVELSSYDWYYQIQWFINDTAILNATNYSFYPKQSGSYSALLKGKYGCTAQSPPVQITENPLPIALTTTIETGFVDSSVVLQSPFPTGQVFSWSPGLGLNDSTLPSPTFTPLQSGTYSFLVKATDNNGCSDTDTVKVDVAAITGTVKGTINNNPVKVYPNPYSGFTNISYQLNEQASVTAEVFNIIGERLSEFVNETQEAGVYHYQFSGEASGMYIIKITISSKAYYQKVVQQ